MKYAIRYTILVALAFFLIAVCYGFKPVSAKLRFPDGYIPMWESQTSDAISTVLNTQNITRITPKFNEEALLTRGDESPNYLEVRFTDGQTIMVYEPLDEFLDRIRSSVLVVVVWCVGIGLFLAFLWEVIYFNKNMRNDK